MDCLWANDSHWVSASSSVGATRAGKLEDGPCPLPSRTYSLVCAASHFRFPGSSADKESVCSAGNPGSIPGLGRSPGEGIDYPLQHSWASLVAQLVKNLPAMQETWVWSLGWEASAAAKSLQSCPTLCGPIDGSPPGSPVPGILQARTLEWVAISFSNSWKWKVKVKSLSRVRLLATPWTVAYRVPPSMRFSRQEYWSGVPLPSPKFWLEPGKPEGRRIGSRLSSSLFASHKTGSIRQPPLSFRGSAMAKPILSPQARRCQCWLGTCFLCQLSWGSRSHTV